MAHERVLIIGGGLTGCALAWELRRRGVDVLVLERAVPGAEASSAAAGILGPRMEAHGQEPLRSIGVESLNLYPAWVAALEAESGVDVGFRRTGLLKVEGDAPDVDARRLEGDDLRAVDPGLAPSVTHGWWLPEEAEVEPARLVQAVSVAAARAGAHLRSGVPVVATGRDAVVLADGTELTGRVVVCAGAWTRRVPGLEGLPIEPVRGQLVELRGDGGPTPVVFGGGGYFVPRGDGRVVVGTTVEHVGFTRGVTVDGLRGILERAARLYPALAGAEVTRFWSGFRPGTPDLLPALGEVDGVWVSSGHYRNGILLAPLTARWLADAMLDGWTIPSLLSVERFR